MFNGLFNFDAKFWKTIIPLLISPGKVSKDYKEGKRSRYSNPFRFYITVSIIFFLVLGLSTTYEKYERLTKEEIKKEVSLKEALNNKEITTDSIQKIVEKELDNSFIPITKIQKEEILKDVKVQANDTVKRKNISGNKISFAGTRIDKFLDIQEKYPTINTNDALDSLNYPKNLKNRFFFQRAKVMNQVLNDNDSKEKFISESLSYASVSLFIFLPLFTLFLKLFYFRRKYTYVDHLIFVFHTQTVFFMLLTIFYLMNIFIKLENLWIFLVIFLIYLFLAMKKFYHQGYFKTIIKFLMLNFVYMVMATIGVVFVALISFAIY